MNIIVNVSEKINVALKEKNQKRVLSLRGLKSELEVNEKAQSPKNQMDVVVQYKNKLQKGLEFYKGTDKEMDLENEINVIKEFLPEQMSTESLRNLIFEVTKNGAEKSLGGIMKALTPIVKGKIENSVLMQEIKDFLK